MLKLIEQERPPPCFDDLVNGAAPLRLSRANRVSTAFGLLGRWATRSWLRTGLASPSTQVAYAKLAWEKRSQIIRKTPRFAYPLPRASKLARCHASDRPAYFRRWDGNFLSANLENVHQVTEKDLVLANTLAWSV
jgi:hypothetical protein